MMKIVSRGLLVAAMVGTLLGVPVAASPAFAATCGDASHLFTSVANGATITTGDTFMLSGIVQPGTGATFTFSVRRPNGNTKIFQVITNLASDSSNCVIPGPAETIPAALIGRGDVTVRGEFVRWEDGQRGTFETFFRIGAGSGFNPAPLPPKRCSEVSHPFINQAGQFENFSGIVYPGSRMYYLLDLRLGSAVGLTIINPTVTAGSNCVLDHRFDALPLSAIVLGNPGAQTDVYATYVRWEDGVTVQQQFVGTLSR